MERRRMYWVNFARLCTGKVPVSRRTVDQLTRQRGGYPLYADVERAATKVAASRERDYRPLREACERVGMAPDVVTNVVTALEVAIEGKDVVVIPQRIDDYPIDLEHFYVPARYQCVWQMEGNQFYIKYQFAESRDYRADVEDLKLYLALSSLEIPASVKRIHPEKQLLLFGDADVHDPDDVDFWAFKFRGFDNGFVLNTPDEVQAWRQRINQTAADVNGIISELEGFLDR